MGPLTQPDGVPAVEILQNPGTADELASSLKELNVEPLW